MDGQNHSLTISLPNVKNLPQQNFQYSPIGDYLLILFEKPCKWYLISEKQFAFCILHFG